MVSEFQPKKVFLCYFLRIKFFSGSSHQGDIAIDDLRVYENPCKITPTNADPSQYTSTTPSTTASTTSPPGKSDCTFENGICAGYENLATNTFNWTREQATLTTIPRRNSIRIEI